MFYLMSRDNYLPPYLIAKDLRAASYLGHTPFIPYAYLPYLKAGNKGPSHPSDVDVSLGTPAWNKGPRDMGTAKSEEQRSFSFRRGGVRDQKTKT